MISVIITAFKEPKTIGKAIYSLIKQIGKNDEIIVTAPDEDTLNEARKIKDKRIRIAKDEGKGKPSALNLAVSKAKGDILILSDGDVFVGDNALKLIMEKFNDENIGAVSGRPISINYRNNKYGYWAYLLTEIANERRKKALFLGKKFFCSGYLFAIRRKLFPKLNENLLSEDGFISHEVYKRGYKISYADKAVVYVKYPDNFKDWILQKRRSAGGYNQLKKMLSIEIRSFKKESSGAYQFIKYIDNLKELIWLIELFFARIYLWEKIYLDIDKKGKNREEIWKRVESTK